MIIIFSKLFSVFFLRYQNEFNMTRPGARWKHVSDRASEMKRFDKRNSTCEIFTQLASSFFIYFLAQD